MASELSEEMIIGYLEAQGSCSVGKLAVRFGCSIEDVMIIVEELISQKKIGFAGVDCQEGCHTCTGCKDDGETELRDTTILTLF